MAWTTPATFTTGNVLTAAQLNTNLRDNTNFLFDPPMCLATRTAAQSIGNIVLADVIWNAADLYDTDSMHDPATNPADIFINTAGVYDLWACVQWTANGTGMRRVAIRLIVGGGKIAFDTDSSATPGQNSAQNLKCQYKFAGGGTTGATVDVWQNSGAALSLLGTSNTASDIDGDPPACYFGASWVGSGT